MESNEPIVTYDAVATQVDDISEYIKKIIPDMKDKLIDGEVIMPTEQE